MSRSIALVGKMGSGKTTIAQELAAWHGYERVALADAVKDGVVGAVNDMLAEHGIRGRNLTREGLERDKAFWRPLLQFWGTEVGRQYSGNDHLWIEAFLRRAAHGTRPVVCDDCRFLNEAAALRKAGFLVVRVWRPEAERQAAAGPSGNGVAVHSSEVELERITPDLVVTNDAHDSPRVIAAALAAWPSLETELPG